MTNLMTGAEMVVRALRDQGVETIFGYPGGAVLPIYDALFHQKHIKHVLVRHEQGAAHAAEGFARSSGKAGVLLVTSGPGATNSVTGLTDALMDSIPVVCITGQVPTHLIGSDAFQECDTVGITRHCTKHNYLVRQIEDLPRILHEAFYVAQNGRPGPVVIDIPKDVQFAIGTYIGPHNIEHKTYRPKLDGDPDRIEQAALLMAAARRPIFYTGGGIINSGPEASRLLRELAELTGFPLTSTLMGLGAYPASGKNWLGMLGMHGTYEANNAMHDCDVMIAIGARFDDRITGRLDAFLARLEEDPHRHRSLLDQQECESRSRHRRRLHACAAPAHRRMAERGTLRPTQAALAKWWAQIDKWRARKSLSFKASKEVIKPQYAVQRLYELTKARDTYITTEVGQHQMWAAQHYHFEAPNRWMTSGGLGTMGYGLPAAIGAQMAHPGALVIDIAGEASILMNIQELSTAAQYRLPVKIFILNNEYMGMVRQWQELLHDGRYSESYSEALPDFVKLAEAYGAHGIRCSDPAKLDDAIIEMLETPETVIFDCVVDKTENCLPMIPSGKAHNEMILPGHDAELETAIDAAGKMLV